MSVKKKSITKFPIPSDIKTDESSLTHKEEAWLKTDQATWNTKWVNASENFHTIIPQGTYAPMPSVYTEIGGHVSEGNQINNLYQIINNQSQTIKALEEIVNKFKAEFLELKRSLGMCATCDNLSSPGDYLCPVCAKKESTV